MRHRKSILMILFCIAQQLVVAQDSLHQVKLTGVVSCEDSTMGVLEGVSIYNINKLSGTVSNKNGEFEIKLGRYDTIVFSTIQHQEKYFFFNQNDSFIDVNISIELFEDTIWLETITILGQKSYEAFKQEILNMELPEDEINLMLPVIDKYAKQNSTGEGVLELKGPLTYLSKKIRLFGRKTKY